jgi:FlaG/FlaF family flagellin (archaellin)
MVMPTKKLLLRKLREDSFAMNPVTAVIFTIATIAIMMIGGFFAGVLHSSLDTSMATPSSADYQARYQMNNTSKYMDTAYGIVNVNLIIYILGGTLALVISAFAIGTGRRD